MTIILGSYTDFERKLIVAAYYTLNELKVDLVTLDQIVSRFELEFDERWARTAISSYHEAGLSRDKLHLGAILQQRIRLTAAGMRLAEEIIKVEHPSFVQRRSDVTIVDSASWTGAKVSLDSPRREKVVELLRGVEGELDELELGNADKAQVLAYVIAARALAESPQPPDDLIWELIARANALAGIGSLFVSIIALFTAAAH